MPTAAVMGGIAAYGAYSSSKANAKSQDTIQAAEQQQSKLSDTLAGYAGQQYALAKPALGKAVDYYSTIAGGNRGAIQGAIAPEVASLTDAYAGTQKYLEQQGIRGGARDTALAEANRAKAGQIGMLPFQARQNAIGQLGQLGAQGVNSAGAMAGAAGQTAYGAGATAVAGGNLAIKQGQEVAGFGSSLAQTLLPYLLRQKPGAGGGFGSGDTTGVPLFGQIGQPMMGPQAGFGYGLQSPLSSSTVSPFGLMPS